MNERLCNNIVYSLAKEAGLIEFEKFDWNPELGSPTYESVMKARKFAELIVRECARVSERTGALNEADYEGEMIADAIKEHFGVQE